MIVTHDSPRIGRLARRLERLGHQVLACHSAKHVCESHLIARADLVMVDGDLRGADGDEAIESTASVIRSVRPRLPLVLLAPRLEADTALIALRKGYDDALATGESKQGLRRCIARLAGRESGRHAVPETGPTFEPGRMLDGTPYRIDRMLGEGGMGSVYLATHVTIERTVALKVLSPHLRLDARLVQSFRREARASSRIGTASIVDVYDFLEFDDGTLVLCMEYVDGDPLDVCFERGDFGLARLVAVTRQLCKGLGAAHRAGIIHRDVKPANVMITRIDDRPDCVKILDFGIASIQAEQRGDRPLTGTPGYMAPETIAREPTSGAVDQYALGCMLYEWASGSLPFEGTTERILTAHVAESPRPLAEVAERELPDPFLAIVDRCLAKDPADRYPSMAALEAALVELQIERGFSTTHDHLDMPGDDDAERAALARRFAATRGGRHRRWIAPLAAAAAFAVASVLGAAALAAQPTPAAGVQDAATSAHVVAALEAAADRRYVLPADGLDTAYQHVRALERLGSSESLAAARRLRSEFANNLRTYGDLYWSYDAGKPFAESFYRQAMLFSDDDSPEVARRSDASSEAVDDLRTRADEGRFTSDEKAMAQSLRVLALPTAQARREEIRRVVEAGRGEPEVVEKLSRLEAEVRGIERVEPSETAERTAPESDANDGDREATPAKAKAKETPAPAARARPSAGQRRAKSERELERAKAARRKGDLGAAERHYSKALDLQPGSLRALDGLANLHFAKGDYRDSLEFARLAARRSPNSGRRWLLVGDAEFKVLHYSKARAAYQKAKQLGHDAADGRLAKIDAKLGQ